jgi:flagellar basal-body rod modification protein FlgD
MSDLNTSVDIYNYYNNQKTTGVYQPAKVPIPTSDVGHKSTTVLPDSDDANNTLSFEDMLLLMVTQLQNQTIDNTADTNDMMNQIIQMTVMQAITDMKSQVDDLTEANILNYTASLVGQTVTLPVYDKEGKLVGEKEGVVTGTGLYNGQRVIFIGDETYLLNQIMAVGKLPAKKPEEGDETEKPGEDGSVDKPEGPGEGESVEKPGEGEATPPETDEGGAEEETLEKALG